METRTPLIQIQRTAYTILPVVMLSLKNIAKSKFFVHEFSQSTEDDSNPLPSNTIEF